MSFLMPLNSLRLSNFLKISAFYSASVYCFAFLTLDLLAVSTLAFAHALSTSKGLQAALALVQGAQEVAWLQKEISGKENNSNNTYSKVWGIHKIPKSAHLSHRLPLPTTDVPIFLANSSRHWQASGVSCGRYQTHCLLVRGRRSIRFISSSEGGDKGGKKVFIQFLCCYCSMAAIWSTSKCLAKSLWRSSFLHYVSSSSCFFHASSSSLFRSAIFTSLWAWCSRHFFSSCCRSRVSVSACLLANSAS